MDINHIIRLFEDGKARANFIAEQIAERGIATIRDAHNYSYQKGLVAGYEIAASTLHRAGETEVQNVG